MCVVFSFSSDTLLSHVEQLLRAVILKISVCDAVLDNNPPGKRELLKTLSLEGNLTNKYHIKK